MQAAIRIATTGVLLAITSSFGCGAQPPTVEVYATPEECFAAAKAALAAKDFKTYVQCLTPESQISMTAGMIRTPLRMEGKLNAAIAELGELEAFDKVKKMLKSLHEAMDRQGIDRTKLPSPAEVLTGKFENDPRFTQAATAVPDKPALLTDLIAATDTDGKFVASIVERLNGTVEKLTVEGDVASATFKRTSGLRPAKFLHFKKQNGGWLIQMMKK